MSNNLMHGTISKWDFETFRVILNDSRLIKSPQYVSQSFKINLTYVRAVIDEYNKSGCVIIQSKINHGKH